METINDSDTFRKTMTLDAQQAPSAQKVPNVPVSPAAKQVPNVSCDFDVIVVGAGVAGCTTARMLASYDMRVCVLEAQNDLACGATRANSGIVHAGFDPAPDTLKARFNVEGCRIYPQWAEALHFAYRNNGTLVCAFSEDEEQKLRELYRRGTRNGVPGLRLIDADELHRIEPAVAPSARAALLAPTAGICDPYDVTYKSALNAANNGVEFRFLSRVVSITRCDVANDLFATEECPRSACGCRWTLFTSDGHTYTARAVVNAAGLFADDINNMVSSHKFDITPVRGEYCLYDPLLGQAFTHTMFQTPTSAGKGVLVSPTVHGNLFIGPNSVPQEDKTELDTTAEGLAGILTAAKKTWPAASRRNIISNFAGLRARSDAGDFIIGPVADAPGFYNIAGFDSPGLTSAPAVAEFVAAEIAAALDAPARADWQPCNAPETALRFAMIDDAQRAKIVAERPAWGRVVCRCCNVTEGEIVEALHACPQLPVLSLDALKWRTGATMGRCHGGFCSPEVVHLMARELGCAPDAIDKRLPGSRVLAEARPDYVALSHAQKASAASKRASSPVSAASHPVERAEAGGGAIGAADAPGAVAGTAGTIDAPAAAMRDTYDIVVVGAGAAGLSAAEAAARKNSSLRILVIDRAATAGGVMNQCIHSGFGLHMFHEELTGPEYAARQMRDIAALNALAPQIDFAFGTTVLSVNPPAAAPSPRYALTLAAKTGIRTVRARAVVLATGSRERGLGALNLAGARPSGVFSAGSAQTFMNLHGCLPGKTAVVMGSGDIGLIMARRMSLAGMKVLGVYELAATPGGLRRNIVQCLNDFDIPLFLSETVTRLEGKTRLEAVVVEKIDPATFNPIPGTARRIPCDTLILSVGLIPETELARAAGARIAPANNGIEVDAALATTLPGVFACGNAVLIHGLADDASVQGSAAGDSAACFCLGVSAAHPAEPAVSVVAPAASAPTFSAAYPAEHAASVATAAPAASATPFPSSSESATAQAVAHPVEPAAPAAAPAAAAPAPISAARSLVCVNCPRGCLISVTLDADGEMETLTGAGCRRGRAYAESELTRPTRVLTLSVCLPGVLEPLSVRTAAPIPRDLMKKAAAAIQTAAANGEITRSAATPIAAGDVVLPHVAQTGVDVIATRSL